MTSICGVSIRSPPPNPRAADDARSSDTSQPKNNTKVNNHVPYHPIGMLEDMVCRLIMAPEIAEVNLGITHVISCLVVGRYSGDAGELEQLAYLSHGNTLLQHENLEPFVSIILPVT